ncbi:odorant receptor 33b-like [Ceratitis capitata]|uniref:odorant receptor 33b-like n=1 Tax=Ceratitis capitata TaxID=7213 RepID=UPI0006188174|nr:odorant receptor 33b-like [Ceratitis capitata]
MSKSKVDAVSIFVRLIFFWRVLGFTTNYNKHLVRIYDVFVTIIVTLAFPMHLMLGVIFAKDKETIFINLAIGISSIACTAKHFMLRPSIDKILYVNNILRQLDERVQNVADTDYYVKQMREKAIFMINFFIVVYFSVAIMALLSALWTGKILYPAYVLLDWQSGTWRYLAVMTFQTFGLNMQIVQNLTNDAYGPMVLCMLSGHVHLLSNRVIHIGHDHETDVDDNYAELVRSIEDYKLLMR